MLPSTSRTSLNRVHSQISSARLRNVLKPHHSPSYLSSHLDNNRHASSATQQVHTRPTSNGGNLNRTGLRSEPWAFTPDAKFQKAQNRTILARCNLALEKEAAAGRFYECLAIAGNMKLEGIQPDLMTYNNLLHAASKQGMSLEAWAIFEDMLSTRIEPDRQSFHHLLNAQRGKESSYMWKVLEKQNELGIPLSQSSYSYIIGRYVMDENLELALQYIHNMKIHGLVPELRAAQDVVVLAAQSGHPRLALDLISSFETESIRRLDHEVWMNCLIACAETLYADGVVRCWEVVVQELNITPDEGLCVAVLHTAARHGLPDLATDALRVLKTMGATWEEHHFAPLIEAFCRANLLKDALVTLDIMRNNNIEPLTETALPILHAISRDVDAIDNTWAVIESMHKEKKRIDVSALNVIVQATVSLGDLQRAVGTYKGYPDYGVKPDVHTFNFLLEGCIAANHRELGDRLLADMKEAKVKPDRDTYRNLILLCLTQDAYEDAFFYLEEMKAGKYLPPLQVYEALIRKCLSTGDARYNIAVLEMEERGYEPSHNLRHELDNASRPSTSSDPSLLHSSPGLGGAARHFIESRGLLIAETDILKTGDDYIREQGLAGVNPFDEQEWEDLSEPSSLSSHANGPRHGEAPGAMG